MRDWGCGAFGGRGLGSVDVGFGADVVGYAGEAPQGEALPSADDSPAGGQIGEGQVLGGKVLIELRGQSVDQAEAMVNES